MVYVGIWVFPKIMVPPNHPFVHRVFHYFHHPFWGVKYPYFWFNTHISRVLSHVWAPTFPFSRCLMTCRRTIPPSHLALGVRSLKIKPCRMWTIPSLGGGARFTSSVYVLNVFRPLKTMTRRWRGFDVCLERWVN